MSSANVVAESKAAADLAKLAAVEGERVRSQIKTQRQPYRLMQKVLIDLIAPRYNFATVPYLDLSLYFSLLIRSIWLNEYTVVQAP